MRAFGAEWEADRTARLHFGEKGHAYVTKHGGQIRLWDWNEGGASLRIIGRATRRPVIDIMERLREGLAGSEKP